MTLQPNTPSPFVAALADLPRPVLTSADSLCDLLHEAATEIRNLDGRGNPVVARLLATAVSLEALTFEEQNAALVEAGRLIAADPTHKGMEINGRPITNLEMHACRAYEAVVDAENIRLHGCCGRQPNAEGFCFGVGPCPRVENKQCE